ncbi:MAG: NAD-dependent epimerase/dehydratase family protein [Bacteroidota bacterium]
MPTAFLTGGTGFVGSHLAERLLARGYTVRALVRSAPKWLDGLDVEIVEGDLSDLHTLTEAASGANLVIHAAALTRAPTLDDLRTANVDGTLRLLDACQTAADPPRRALVVSSLAAVGPSGDAPLTENAPLAPISNYGRSKAEMEERIAAHPFAKRVTIARPPAVYGPREADIYTVIKTAAKQHVFPIVGDPNARALDLVYVTDLARGLLDAAESETAAGETYFVGGQAHAWAEIHRAVTQALGTWALKIKVSPRVVAPIGTVAEAVGKAMGTYPPLNREKAREARETWVASSEKAREAFGYEPRVGLAEGMRRSVAWYREAGWL